MGIRNRGNLHLLQRIFCVRQNRITSSSRVVPSADGNSKKSTLRSHVAQLHLAYAYRVTEEKKMELLRETAWRCVPMKDFWMHEIARAACNIKQFYRGYVKIS